MPPRRRVLTDRLRLEKFLITGIVEPIPFNKRTTKVLSSYQSDVVNYMNTHTRLMIVHGTGSGKSFTGANIVNNYLNSSANKIALVIAPGSVLSQLKDDILEVTGGMKPVFFMSYELMGEILNPVTHPVYVRLLRKFLNNMLVVCDEIHSVNDNQKKKMFKPLFQTLADAHKMVIMTATPVKNKKKDLVMYMKLLKIPVPSNESNYEKAFKGKVSVYDPPQRQGPYVPGQRHFPNLNQSQRNVVVKITNQNKNRILRQPITSYSNMRAIERNVFGNRNPKFETFREIYLRNPGRTIVYFEEKKSADDFVKYVEQALPDLDIRKLIGGMSSTVKKNYVRNENVDIYAVTSAAKVGLDFKGISNIVFMEYPWTSADYWQIVGRGVRSGSHNSNKYRNKTVKVFNLMYRSQSNNRRKFKNEIQLNRIGFKQKLANNVKAGLKSYNNVTGVAAPRSSAPTAASTRPRRTLRSAPAAAGTNRFNIGNGRVYNISGSRPVVMHRGVAYTPQNWTRRVGAPRVQRTQPTIRVPRSRRGPPSLKPESFSRIRNLTRSLGAS